MNLKRLFTITHASYVRENHKFSRLRHLFEYITDKASKLYGHNKIKLPWYIRWADRVWLTKIISLSLQI